MIVKLVTIILALILHVNCNLTQEESTKLQEFLSSLSSDKIPNKFKQAKDKYGLFEIFAKNLNYLPFLNY